VITGRVPLYAILTVDGQRHVPQCFLNYWVEVAGPDEAVKRLLDSGLMPSIVVDDDPMKSFLRWFDPESVEARPVHKADPPYCGPRLGKIRFSKPKHLFDGISYDIIEWNEEPQPVADPDGERHVGGAPIELVHVHDLQNPTPKARYQFDREGHIYLPEMYGDEGNQGVIIDEQDEEGGVS
jgi:hypothetical protein